MLALQLNNDRAAEVNYAELLRVPALSVGHYHLPVGAQDPQQPHTEDEVYVVIRGRAVLRTDSHTTIAEPGAILYVPAGETHRFTDIEEPLDVVVVFAPPEHTLTGGQA